MDQLDCRLLFKGALWKKEVLSQQKYCEASSTLWNWAVSPFCGEIRKNRLLLESSCQRYIRGPVGRGGHTHRTNPQLKAEQDSWQFQTETSEDRMAGKQGQKPMFEASWERIDSTRNPELYESREGVTLLRGQEVTGSSRMEGSMMQRLTEEEVRNVEKAAEKMNDREDWFQLFLISFF